MRQADDLARQLRAAGTAALCSADDRVRAIDFALSPLVSGICIAGRALTARSTATDNAAVHRAVHQGKAGDVLVVDAGQDRTRGLFGDILGEACLCKQIAAAIVRGSVRDIASLRALRFPVWATSTNPAPATKAAPGEVNVALHWVDISVYPGDWIIADDDGVAVIGAQFAEQAAAAAARLASRESDIRARLAEGESTCDIFGIQP